MLSDTLKRELSRYAVGEKIRQLRWQKDLRLTEVARRSGLSASLLSKVERGQSVPSLAALLSIANALEVTLAYFFPKPKRTAPAMTRKAERILLPEFPRAKESSFDFECLNFSAVEPRVNCYHAHFRPSTRSHSHSHPGSEFLFVVTGSLQVTLAGEDYVLEQGDSMHFDSSLSHNYVKVGTDDCSALVVTFPTLSAVAGLDTHGLHDSLRLRGSEIIWRRVG